MSKARYVFLVFLFLLLLVVDVSCIIVNPTQTSTEPTEKEKVTETITTTVITQEVNTIGGLPAKKHIDQQYGFEFLYPNSWTYKQQDSIDYYYSPDANCWIIILVSQAGDNGLETQVEILRLVFCKLGWELYEKGEVFGDSNTEGCLDVFILEDSNNSSVHEHLYLKSKTETWVVDIVVGCFWSRWTEYGDLMTEIIKSCRLN